MTAADLVALPDDRLAWEMLAAMEAADHEFARWAVLVDLDSASATAQRLYLVIHDAYAALWLAMGDAFHERLWPLAEIWRTKGRRK